MTDEANVASATDTQAQPPTESATPELKSTDTGVLSAIKAQAETATPPPKVDKPEADKPDSHADPADKGTDADSPADHQDDDDRDDDRKLEPWVKKRLKRAEERGRRQAERQVLEMIKSLGLRPEQSAKPQGQSAEPAPEPSATPKTLADFDYDVEKFTQYQIREGVKAALAERDAENERRAAQAKAEEARKAFEQRKAEFEKRVGEGAWEEMVSANVDVPQEVIDLLMGHERDLDIAHYLVHHPDELDKLRGKSKLVIARELASIDAKLSGSNARELPPKTTKAPSPPPKVPSATTAVKSITNMSTEERIAEWRRQRQQRRQA